jgi:hypothetical protein
MTRRNAGRATRSALALALALTALHPGAQAQSLFGRDHDAVDAVLPDPMPKVPAPQDTLAFQASATTTNRFAVDPASLAIDGETVVRFMLIVTSAGGVRNVSYEAFRCYSGEQRLLAIARADGTWSVLGKSQWRPLERDDKRNSQYRELYSRLCAGGAAAAQKPEQLADRIRTAQ